MDKAEGDHMNKVKCTIQYDGTNFSGFQIQPRGRTIQGEVERALKKMHKGSYVRVHPSGRTDKGVHAVGQVIHFETPLHLDVHGWKQALNAMLPTDIHVQSATYAKPTFHCRYDAIEKEYRYIVDRSKEPNVFRQNYAFHFPYELEIDALEKACLLLQGEHDFTSFSSAKDTSKGSKIRTLYEVSIREEAEELTFLFRGDGYLYNMVRIMVGTLLDIGQGRRDATDIKDLFAQKDRTLASATAPSQGLYLWEVTYPKDTI